jgi:hypothetical protein
VQDRINDAHAHYAAGMARVRETPDPKGQKFPTGSRVHIAKDLGPTMSHFESDVDATVQYVYAHAFGGDNVTSYSLNIDGYGSVAWYYENQLTAI